jgi:hypothetical protein
MLLLILREQVFKIQQLGANHGVINTTKSEGTIPLLTKMFKCVHELHETILNSSVTPL